MVAAPEYYVQETPDGVSFENTFEKDAAIFFFGGRGTDNGPTGQYLFMKYKALEQNIYIQIYSATDSAEPVAGRDTVLYKDVDIYNDEEWHILVIDLSKLINMPTGDDGEYYIQHFRMDIEGSEFVTLELAYLGIDDSLEDIVEYIKATETDESVKDVCSCPAVLQAPALHNETVHKLACQICGEGQEVVHSGAGCGVWNDELGYYASNTPCAVCGATAYNVGANISVEAENITFWEYGWGTVGAATVTNDGVNAAIFKAHKNLGPASIGHLAINAGANVSGQHFVFRYRIDPEGEETQRTLGFKFGTTASTTTDSVDVTLVADGQWHVVYMDLSELTSYAADDNGQYVVVNDIVLDATSWGNEAFAYIDWFKMYDNVDNMPAEYLAAKVELVKVCDHNNLTVVIEAAVEPTCTVPGKTAVMGCAVCNEYQAGGEEIPAQHKVTVVVEEAVPATCTTPGKTVKMGCENCEYTVGGEEIPAQHKLTVALEEAVAPTCTEAGKTAKIGCSECDYTEGGDEIPAHHATNSWRESDGLSRCAVCDEPVETYLNYLWDRDNLIDMGFANATWTHTVDGVKYTGISNPASQYFNQVIVLEDHPSGLGDSNYFIIKYKVNVGTDLYIALDYTPGHWDWVHERTSIIADGEWHIAVVECLESTIVTLKLYFNSAEGTPTVEVAYAGVASTLDQITALLEAKGDAEGVTLPNPPAPPAGGEDPVDPVPPAGGEEGGEESGEESEDSVSYFWAKEELMNVNVSNVASREETEDGVKFVGAEGTAFTFNQIIFMEDGNPANGNPAYFENVNYFVIKYKVSEGTACDMALDYPYHSEGNWTWLGSLNEGGKGLLVIDGDWHTLITECAGSDPYTCKVYFDAGEVEIAYVGFATTEAQINEYVANN